MSKKGISLTKQQAKIAVGVILGLVVLIVVLLLIIGVDNTEGNNKKEIITTTAIEKIIKIDELSTFQAIYNGVARAYNTEEPEEIDFYVSYDARVQAGIDFNLLMTEIDPEAKLITVTIPKVKITDVIVDIQSMEFIFVDDDSNTATVSERAYKECIADVTNESAAEKQILALAQNNAENIIKALLNPFVEQSGADYSIKIVHEVAE